MRVHHRPLLFAVLVFALGLAACEGCRSGASPWNLRSAGADAGPPTVRLYLVSDLAGALEPCGCTKDQLGGLDHFGAWVKSEHARAPAALVAAAGPLFFMDEKLEGERAYQDQAKAEAIANVLRELGFAAFAPGVNDWADHGVDGLAKLAKTSAATAIVDGSGAPPFADEIVRDIGGVRVGFVGFGQAPAAKSPPNVEEAVARGVNAAKQQGANVLVALAAVGRGEAKRIADAVPELTAIVVGSARLNGEGNTSAPQPERVGDVLVLQTGNHLQSVAVLDLYVREPLTPGHVVTFADGTGVELARKRDDLTRRVDDLHVKIAGWERDPSIAPADVDARRRELAELEAQRDGLDVKPPPAKGSFFRYTLKELRPALGKDPTIESLMLGYYKAVDDHNRVAFADRSPPPHEPGQATYVGKDECTRCHADARAVWNGTAHAGAYASLSSQFKEFNLECVGCHVTGYERPGGSTVAHVETLRDVQCEVCHGPGSKHVVAPLDPTAIIAKPQPSGCLDCHHSPHVENFDPSIKLREILGPGHGLPRKK
ncbi:MAG TPA: multiheme c-type cytochrome [Polyangiaceae bacterium]|nr:multiheme c-type cytochrome [Polyangiaceae bacterium]